MLLLDPRQLSIFIYALRTSLGVLPQESSIRVPETPSTFHRHTQDTNFTNLHQLVALITSDLRDNSCNSCLRPDHSDQMAQFVCECRGASGRCERSPRAIAFGNADETGRTLASPRSPSCRIRWHFPFFVRPFLTSRHCRLRQGSGVPRRTHFRPFTEVMRKSRARFRRKFASVG